MARTERLDGLVAGLIAAIAGCAEPGRRVQVALYTGPPPAGPRDAGGYPAGVRQALDRTTPKPQRRPVRKEGTRA